MTDEPVYPEIELKMRALWREALAVYRAEMEVRRLASNPPAKLKDLYERAARDNAFRLLLTALIREAETDGADPVLMDDVLCCMGRDVLQAAQGESPEDGFSRGKEPFPG